MPFAGYANFDECVRKNQNKRDPKAYCASIKQKVEGKAKPFVFYSEPLNYFLETKADDSKRHVIKGYMTTSDRDLVGDIVTDSCMKSMLNQMTHRAIKMDIEHESWQGKDDIMREKAKTINPIGKINRAYKDGTGIFIEGELNPHHRRFDEVLGSMKGGFLDSFSIAYIPTATKPMNIKGQDTRLLDDITLLNVALTGNPINTNARMAPIMAKSLEFMKSFSSNDDINQEENMAEEEKEEPTEESESTEKKPEEPKPEAKPEVKALKKEIVELKAKIKKLEKKAEEEEKEPEKPAEGEAEKTEESEETKSMDRLDRLEKELAEVKAILSKPQYKALSASVEDIAKKTATDEKVLDHVR